MRDKKNTLGAETPSGLVEFFLKLNFSIMKIRLTLLDWIDKKDASKKMAMVLTGNCQLGRLSKKIKPGKLGDTMKYCSSHIEFQLIKAEWTEYINADGGHVTYKVPKEYYRPDIYDVYKVRRQGYLLDFADSGFCRCKVCSVCMWRRSKKYRAKVLSIIPHLDKEYFAKGYRAIFLTFTIKNMAITDLGAAITLLNEAWKYLYNHKSRQKKALIPVEGFIKSLEVTRNALTDEAHPHLHVLALVTEDYFSSDSETYLTHPQWLDLWRQALDVTIEKQLKKLSNNSSESRQTRNFLEGQRGYDPSVFVKAVECGDELKAIPELTKYMAKDSDLFQDGLKIISEDNKVEIKSDDGSWLVLFLDQTFKRRAISLGGVFKEDPIIDELPKIEDELDESTGQAEELEIVLYEDETPFKDCVTPIDRHKVSKEIEEKYQSDQVDYEKFLLSRRIFLKWLGDKYEFDETGCDYLDEFFEGFELDIIKIREFEEES